MLALVLLLVTVVLPLTAQAQCPGVDTTLTPFAKEKLTISTTPVSLTQAIYKPTGVTPSMGVFSIEGGTIRYETVGTPTADDGHAISGTPPTTAAICGLPSIAAFRAIRVDADATLFITYYKPAP